MHTPYRTIDFRRLRAYYLTTGADAARSEHMRAEFRGFDLREVRPVWLGGERRKQEGGVECVVTRFQSTATGFMRAVERGLREASGASGASGVFEPFMIMEDDVSLLPDTPWAMPGACVRVPETCDILFAGVSSSFHGTDERFCAHCDRVHATGPVRAARHDDHLYRVANMLSFHGVVVCSALGANAISRAMMEAFCKDEVCDVHTASMLGAYEVYALNVPLVYQDVRFGGQEAQTKTRIDALLQEAEGGAESIEPSASVDDRFVGAKIATICS